MAPNGREAPRLTTASRESRIICISAQVMGTRMSCKMIREANGKTFIFYLFEIPNIYIFLSMNTRIHIQTCYCCIAYELVCVCVYVLQNNSQGEENGKKKLFLFI